jgi:glycosyltransferase involved in cell wall biosynthesis
MRVAFVSVVPSPYQRDLFQALGQRPELALSVFYMEAAAPDSPWPRKPLAAYERILRGFWFPLGKARCHVNWPLPDLRKFDVVVLNTLMSITAQWLMRVVLRGRTWISWGERQRRGGTLQKLLASPLHQAAAIVGIGQAAREDYHARFPEPRHYSIPYHCDLEPFLTASAERERSARKSDEVVFLLCGQMIARKGVDLLLTAFSHLTNARLVLVGREAELPSLLAGLPDSVRARVFYAGFRAPEELPAFFAQADVFVLPSRYDGWGVVVNQALGAGLPIICSDQVGAGQELVEPEVNGLRFRSGDAVSLLEQMRRFVEEPALIEKWGKASRVKAERWTPAVGAQKWIDVLQAVSRQ